MASEPFAVAALVQAYTELLHEQVKAAIAMTPPPPAQPSDEEMARRKAHRIAVDNARDRVLAAIKAVTEPALRAVLDLHAPDGIQCKGCDPGSYAESGAWWPCSTITTLAPFIGVSESDLKLI